MAAIRTRGATTWATIAPKRAHQADGQPAIAGPGAAGAPDGSTRATGRDRSSRRGAGASGPSGGPARTGRSASAATSRSSPVIGVLRPSPEDEPVCILPGHRPALQPLVGSHDGAQIGRSPATPTPHTGLTGPMPRAMLSRCRRDPRPGAPTSPSSARPPASAARSSSCRTPIELVEPIPFLAVRFTIGAVVLWPMAWRRPSTPREWRDGGLVGLSLLAGYVLQTIGLQYTDSATSAFLTYLLVVFVPLLASSCSGAAPTRSTLARRRAGRRWPRAAHRRRRRRAAGFGRGEVLTLGCAVAFAAHVVAAGRDRAPPRSRSGSPPSRCPSWRSPARARAWPSGATTSRPRPWPRPSPAPSWPPPGPSCSRSTASERCPPTRASLLLLLEPVFAGGAGRRRRRVPDGPPVPGGGGDPGRPSCSASWCRRWLDRTVRLRQAGLDNDRS